MNSMKRKLNADLDEQINKFSNDVLCSTSGSKFLTSYLHTLFQYAPVELVQEMQVHWQRYCSWSSLEHDLILSISKFLVNKEIIALHLLNHSWHNEMLKNGHVWRGCWLQLDRRNWPTDSLGYKQLCCMNNNKRCALLYVSHLNIDLQYCRVDTDLFCIQQLKDLRHITYSNHSGVTTQWVQVLRTSSQITSIKRLYYECQDEDIAVCLSQLPNLHCFSSTLATEAKAIRDVLHHLLHVTELSIEVLPQCTGILFQNLVQPHLQQQLQCLKLTAFLGHTIDSLDERQIINICRLDNLERLELHQWDICENTLIEFLRQFASTKVHTLTLNEVSAFNDLHHADSFASLLPMNNITKLTINRPTSAILFQLPTLFPNLFQLHCTHEDGRGSDEGLNTSRYVQSLLKLSESNHLTQISMANWSGNMPKYVTTRFPSTQLWECQKYSFMEKVVNGAFRTPWHKQELQQLYQCCADYIQSN